MQSTAHISSQFDSDLAEIERHVLQLGGLVEAQIRDAIEGLDPIAEVDLRAVVDGDQEINALQVRIDAECANLIARRQPTATDLRLVLGIGKAVTDLERIGDEAAKIARFAMQIRERGGTAIPIKARVIKTASLAVAMLKNALDSLARRDADAARAVIRSDSAIDDDFRRAARELLTFMMEEPRAISSALDIMWIAKGIERIGDHAKNVAEHVIFVTEATDVRHSRQRARAIHRLPT